MGQDPITLIIRTLGELYAFVVIMRFLLQMARADYYNPISQAVVKLTSVPMAPLQKLIPRMGRFDLSALILAWGVKFATLFLMFMVLDQIPNVVQLLLYAGVGVIDTLLTIMFWAVLASVIISWVAPGSYHPGPQLIQQLTEPMFALARKVIPPIGGLDLSPILIFLVIQIVKSQLSRLII